MQDNDEHKCIAVKGVRDILHVASLPWTAHTPCARYKPCLDSNREIRIDVAPSVMRMTVVYGVYHITPGRYLFAESIFSTSKILHRRICTSVDRCRGNVSSDTEHSGSQTTSISRTFEAGSTCSITRAVYPYACGTPGSSKEKRCPMLCSS